VGKVRPQSNANEAYGGDFFQKSISEKISTADEALNANCCDVAFNAHEKFKP
jgi:hypothetical protein